VIDAPEGSVNGCNNRMVIPEYDLEYAFKTGENIIEFTPETTGNFQYSCWMGMIRSSITVVETEAEVAASDETEGADGNVGNASGDAEGADSNSCGARCH
jgi:plastocyanin domain-containing protein